MISILFLAADPTDESRLRLGEELREIQEKLQLAKLRDHFSLDQRMSIRPSDLSQALLDITPEIVHFSGHGTSEGAICIENKLGQMHPLQVDALSALFEQFKEHIKCVILNACYSDLQAQAISQHINYVIGMNKAIGDKAAIAFSVGFYQALGAGRSIEDSYKLGCVQIRLENIPEHLTPSLIVNRSTNISAPTRESRNKVKTGETAKVINRLSINEHGSNELEVKTRNDRDSLVIPNSLIPLLPKSIAVGLQDSLIQYSIELKFLLLFFEKPLAILSNTGFNFISEETAEAVKQGRKARTNAFENTDVIQHLELLATEEWEELTSYCETLYRETILTITEGGVEGNEMDEVDEIFSSNPLGKLALSY